MKAGSPIGWSGSLLVDEQAMVPHDGASRWWSPENSFHLHVVRSHGCRSGNGSMARQHSVYPYLDILLCGATGEEPRPSQHDEISEMPPLTPDCKSWLKSRTQYVPTFLGSHPESGYSWDMDIVVVEVLMDNKVLEYHTHVPGFFLDWL
jgi:hypothetical protein